MMSMRSVLPRYGWHLAQIAAFSVLAAGVAAAETAIPSALVCAFDTASVSIYEDGVFTTTQKPERLAFTIASIDLAQRSAQLIGSVGVSPLLADAAPNQLVFLEATQTGNMTFTTVFLEPRRGFVVSAVHSRHMLMSGGPIVSQYVGTCDAKY